MLKNTKARWWTRSNPEDGRAPWILACLALVLSVGVLGPNAQASDDLTLPLIIPIDLQGPGGGEPGGGWAPPKAPFSKDQCLQDCFDQYVANALRCKQVACIILFWITIDCDDDKFEDCLSKADEVWDACRAFCNHVDVMT